VRIDDVICGSFSNRQEKQETARVAVPSDRLSRGLIASGETLTS
jgi:hypothetical protein